jgi:hypothetical protein
MSAKALSNLSRGVVFKDKAANLALGVCTLILLVSRGR